MNHPEEHLPKHPAVDAVPTLADYKKIVREKERIQKVLENKVKELDRSNKELEEFAYIASHDLQEPLRKITAFSERLKERLPATLEPEVQVYLSRMLVATGNMRILIESLLEFSRTSRNTEPFGQVDLNNVIKQVKTDLELNIEESKTIIEQENLPTIEATAVQMIQLFTNLIGNAIKFRKPGLPADIHISSRLVTGQEKENYHIHHNGNVYMISVTDNGIGFPQEYSLRIFQLFQRLHGKAEYPGSGIGLTICKKIAENHKGTLFARSELGARTAFMVILPEHQS